jgi:tetratricopeptide (TPR) repeat protein
MFIVALVLGACASAPVSSSRGIDALAQQAAAARDRRDYPEAARLYRELAQRSPGDAEAWRWLGTNELQLGHLDLAIDALSRSLAIQELAPVQYNLGHAYGMAGRVEEALPHLRRAVELKPTYELAWEGVARASLATGRFQEAAAAVLRAKELAPDREEVNTIAIAIAKALPPELSANPALPHHARAGELAAAGRFPEAEAEYEKALSLDPSFADCHYNLGILARRRGDQDRAEREYRSAIAGFAPAERSLKADAQNNLADLLIARSRSLPEAVALAREAISIRGERASYLDTLARGCDASGDQRCAVEAFEKLLRSPELPDDVRANAKARLDALRHAGRP